MIFFPTGFLQRGPVLVGYESMVWEGASALLIPAGATAAGASGFKAVRSSASEEVSAHFSLEHPLVPDLPGSLWSISLQFHYINISMFLTLNWYWPRLLNACLGDCPARLLTKPSPKISGSVLQCIVLDCVTLVYNVAMCSRENREDHRRFMPSYGLCIFKIGV